MHVDKTGKQIRTLQVNRLAAVQIGLGHRRHGHDMLTFDDDRMAFKNLHVLGSVKHMGVDVRRFGTGRDFK